MLVYRRVFKFGFPELELDFFPCVGEKGFLEGLLMIHGPTEYSTWKVDGDRHSHVLVYHGPVLFVTFWELLAIYFHYGVTESNWSLISEIRMLHC